MKDSTFKSHGYVIDVERLYRAMYDLRVAEGDEIVFNGGLVEVNGKLMRAMKRLLNDLFGVPATENYHYTGDRVRSATRDYLEDWDGRRMNLGAHLDTCCTETSALGRFS